MIARVVEYVIRCDHADCHDGNWNALGCHTRDDCATEAEKLGWVRCSRNRWLCPKCAERARSWAAKQATAT